MVDCSTCTQIFAQVALRNVQTVLWLVYVWTELHIDVEIQTPSNQFIHKRFQNEKEQKVLWGVNVHVVYTFWKQNREKKKPLLRNRVPNFKVEKPIDFFEYVPKNWKSFSWLEYRTGSVIMEQTDEHEDIHPSCTRGVRYTIGRPG